MFSAVDKTPKLLRLRKLWVSCSLALEKREPFWGKTIFSGAVTKKGKHGATEQLRHDSYRGWTKTILHHLETMVETIVLWVFLQGKLLEFG